MTGDAYICIEWHLATGRLALTGDLPRADIGRDLRTILEARLRTDGDTSIAERCRIPVLLISLCAGHQWSEERERADDNMMEMQTCSAEDTASSVHCGLAGDQAFLKTDVLRSKLL